MSQATAESIRKPDPTAAERARRYRARKRQAVALAWRDALPAAVPNGTVDALPAVTQRDAAPVTARATPRVTVMPPDSRVLFSVGRSLIGLTLIGAALFVAFTSMRANAWLGYAMSVDDNAGHIFASLTVTAEMIALLLPTTAALYVQMGDRWPAVLSWMMTPIVCAVVFFAASGFVLTNVGDKTVMREQAMSTTPAVEVAQRALDDAKAARDRECIRVGPVCRHREDAVVTRQGELTAAMTTASTQAGAMADPQAAALGIAPATRQMLVAFVLVLMCLGAGIFLRLGWGLVFRR
jgi:hypothetical protein